MSRGQSPVATDAAGQMAVEAHLQGLRRRSLSPETLKIRATSLRSLVRHLGPERPLLSASPADVDAWIDWMLERRMHVATRRIYQTHVRLFFQWAQRRGLVDDDPTRDVVLPLVHPGQPRPIGESDLQRAIDAASGDLRAWLVLGAYCGLRSGEIARLRREDVVDVKDLPRLVVAFGKGGRTRAVPLSPAVVAELRPHLRGRRGRLWLDGLRRPEEMVTKGIANHLRGLGIQSTSHNLRHRFGTQVYQRSRDLRMTQAMLGHASPMTTQVYAAWDQGRGVEVLAALGESLASPAGDGVGGGAR